jgi:hypothetical protein
VTALSTAKLAFAALFFGAQALLVVRSHVSGDPRFGYRMFAETTFFRMRLLREVAGELVYAPGGHWTTASGERVSWSSDVRDFRMSPLEREMRAKIGLVTTLTFAQRALDWKIERLPASDRETTRLMLEVDWRKADGEKGTTRLESKARSLP